MPSKSLIKGGPYTGAKTVFLPPIVTDLFLFLANCTNCSGALEQYFLARPFGKWTLSPLISHPAFFNILIDSGSSRKSIPILDGEVFLKSLRDTETSFKIQFFVNA